MNKMLLGASLLLLALFSSHSNATPIEITFSGMLQAGSMYDSRTGNDFNWSARSFVFSMLIEDTPNYYYQQTNPTSSFNRGYTTVLDTKLSYDGVNQDLSDYSFFAMTQASENFVDWLYFSIDLNNVSGGISYASGLPLSRMTFFAIGDFFAANEAPTWSKLNDKHIQNKFMLNAYVPYTENLQPGDVLNLNTEMVVGSSHTLKTNVKTISEPPLFMLISLAYFMFIRNKKVLSK
jgi:hypothetical protein